jgi:diaminohydroxyphosphoribosylaminopyrimidine deaminase/5-amino-6-(5-phosphoribosylamino)uracil reductase
MNRALVLARRGMGFVRPNPPVGAVVLRDGRIVGEGYHTAAGEDHAEIVALRAAGERARGASLFVTLEPCNHEGRTPPCVPAVIRSGISRVHIAASDPNPDSGAGAEALKQAGIEVIRGPGEREAAHLLAGFRSRLERRRPRFLLKMAASVDGRIASSGGDSRWISSPVSRAWVHRRRREADAIAIGSGTALRDDPALTTRHVRGRNPDRLVLDSRLRLSPEGRVWTENGTRRVAVTLEGASEERRKALQDRGVEVWTLPPDPRGKTVSLSALAERLGTEGYTNILVEGGGTLAGALFRDHLVDTAWIVVARHLLLGGGGPGWAEGLSVSAVPRALKIARTDLRRLGPDWLLTLVPESARGWDPETNHV